MVVWSPTQQTQKPKITNVLTEPQRALLSTIDDGHKAIDEAEKILDTKVEVPDLGTDPVSVFSVLALAFS